MASTAQNSLSRRLMSAADVRRIDAAAHSADPQDGLAALLRRAGAAVAEAAQTLMEQRPGPAAREVVVLAGAGLNGADGVVAARLLAEQGGSTAVVLLQEPAAGLVEGSAAGSAAGLGASLATGALDAYRAAGGRVVSVSDRAAMEALASAGLIIDALFGVGLSRPVEGDARALIEVANGAAAGGVPMLSVDMPSGVSADTGRVLGAAIRADRTVTFVAPKRGHFLADGALLSGEVLVADIGAPPEALETWPEEALLVSREAPPPNLTSDLAKRVDAHKYEHGSVLAATGGFGATGAARLSARAALRVGAGLVTLAAPKSAMIECACAITALMLRSAETPEDFAALLQDARINAVLIGPGHASHRQGAARSRVFVEAILASEPCRAGMRAVVLDADALTCWTTPEPLFAAIAGAPVVLTPHGGEFARLFPDLAARLTDPSEAAGFGRIEAGREAARRSGATVLVKGFDTVVAEPSGRLAVQCAAGERAAPWLATAGSGDVLAGMICGLLARGLAPFEAATYGAFLHLEAGRAAGPGLIAEDLPEALPGVLSALLEG